MLYPNVFFFSRGLQPVTHGPQNCHYFRIDFLSFCFIFVQFKKVYFQSCWKVAYARAIENIAKKRDGIVFHHYTIPFF